MDQGVVADIGDRRTWTPSRVLLLALGAVAGGILLSVVLGGPAHADAPSDPSAPAATRTSSSVVDRIGGVLSQVTQSVTSPVDDLVAQVTTGPAADALPASPASDASATAPAASAPTAAVLAPLASGALPAAVDRTLAATPLSGTGLWQGLIGPRPVHALIAPLADGLRPVAPGIADLLAPPAASLPTGAFPASSPLTAPSSGSADASPPAADQNRSATSREGTPTIGSGGSAPLDPTPASRTGMAPDSMAPSGPGGIAAAALLGAAVIFLLIALRALRRRGWELPGAPVLGADVSPD